MSELDVKIPSNTIIDEHPQQHRLPASDVVLATIGCDDRELISKLRVAIEQGTQAQVEIAAFDEVDALVSSQPSAHIVLAMIRPANHVALSLSRGAGLDDAIEAWQSDARAAVALVKRHPGSASIVTIGGEADAGNEAALIAEQLAGKFDAGAEPCLSETRDLDADRADPPRNLRSPDCPDTLPATVLLLVSELALRQSAEANSLQRTLEGFGTATTAGGINADELLSRVQRDLGIAKPFGGELPGTGETDDDGGRPSTTGELRQQLAIALEERRAVAAERDQQAEEIRLLAKALREQEAAIVGFLQKNESPNEVPTPTAQVSPTHATVPRTELRPLRSIGRFISAWWNK